MAEGANTQPKNIRVATFNIRNIRALDQASWWPRRRKALAEAITNIDADIWGLQEAYSLQNRWLQTHAFGMDWDYCGRGRNVRGGGEMCPIWVRRSRLRIRSFSTLWYGAKPTTPGSRLPGAKFPRCATLAELHLGIGVIVVNTHLDERSAQRRSTSLQQLAEWLDRDHRGRPTIVAGDMNTTLEDPAFEPLLELGLQPVLNPSLGPTSHGFGDDKQSSQIDHIFVSRDWTVHSVMIHRDAGYASDHWPVSANLQSALISSR